MRTEGRDLSRNINPVVSLNSPFRLDKIQDRSTDLTLRIEDQEFKVHKWVLATISDYFYSLFSQLKEADQKIIVIKDVDPRLFRYLINLIYGQKYPMDNTIVAVFILVEYFQIRGIEVDTYLMAYNPQVEDFEEYLGLVEQIFPVHLPESIYYWIEKRVHDYYEQNRIGKEERDRLLEKIDILWG